jgi:uncharacterized protein YndB with AHSA1/START domain
MESLDVRWPARYVPAKGLVHVRNELTMQAAPEVVWAWLVRARDWPKWYMNSEGVEYLDSPAQDLANGTRFRWKTFGVALESTVLELVPGERLAWDAHGLGVDAYHAWVLSPTEGGGCHVLTEESQHGWLAHLGNWLMPNRMHKYHQLWLEGLRDNCWQAASPGAAAGDKTP